MKIVQTLSTKWMGFSFFISIMYPSSIQISISAEGCPNKKNRFHECTAYCDERWTPRNYDKDQGDKLLGKNFLISNSSGNVGYGWAGWAIAHPGFGRSVNTISTKGGRLCPPTLLLAHPALGSFIRHCHLFIDHVNNCVKFKKDNATK